MVRTPVATVQGAVARRQRVMVRTQQTQVFGTIVPPVAVDVVNVQRYFPRHWITFRPAAHNAGTVFLEQVVPHVSRHVGPRPYARQCARKPRLDVSATRVELLTT